MKSNAEEAAAPTSDGGGGRVTRKNVTKFSENDKENFNIYEIGGNVGSNKTKSPVPVGYPRLPLQDITAVLQPLNNMSDEEEPSAGTRKPFTRSQSFRKSGSVHTTVLTERTSKNANRAGPSKTRKKQEMKIAMDDKIIMEIAVDENTKTIIQADDTVQLKEETVHLMRGLSSSENLIKLTLEGQYVEAMHTAAVETPVKVALEVTASGTAGLEFSKAILAEEEGRTASEKPKESRSPSSFDTRNQYSQDQKRRKPFSTRSRVSSFR